MAVHLSKRNISANSFNTHQEDQLGSIYENLVGRKSHITVPLVQNGKKRADLINLLSIEKEKVTKVDTQSIWALTL